MAAALCFRCGREQETILHSLRDCHFSRAVWEDVGVATLPAGFFNLQLHDWVLHNLRCSFLFNGASWKFFFAIAIWLLWFWRNSQLHNIALPDPKIAKQIILAKTKEAWDMTTGFPDRLRYVGRVSWIRPSPGYVKLNVDGSLRGESGYAAAGGVVRDENGLWLQGFTCKLGRCSVIITELRALYHGLMQCWKLGLRKVQAESDSLEAIQKIEELVMGLGTGPPIVRAIVELLQRDWECKLTH